MRRVQVCVMLLAGAVTLLCGCSGSGVPAADIAGRSLQALAADQLSAVTLFAAWTRMLYVKSTQEASPPNILPQPDGTLWFEGTNSDGSVYHYEILLPDQMGSPGRGTVTWPDGTSYTSEWDATVWSGDFSQSTDRIRYTFPTGATMECTIVTKYGQTTQSSWDGTATTPQGSTMQFHLDRTQNAKDKLTLNLPGGSVMQWEVSIADVPGASNWPVFARGARGTYQSPGGPVLQIAAKGVKRWNNWKLSAPDGRTGEFSLDENLLGQGQWTQGSTTLGALRWGADGLGILDQLGTGQQQVTPSAAALDFQINRWIANGAALGPMPIY